MYRHELNTGDDKKLAMSEVQCQGKADHNQDTSTSSKMMFT